MKENEILQNINTAYDESKSLLDSALLIKANEMGEDVRVPTSFMNSSFGMWLYTDGLSFSKKPWFDSLVEQHQLVYSSYSKLFRSAKEEQDVSEFFAVLDKKINDFHEKLDEVKQEFTEDLPEPEPEPEPKKTTKKKIVEPPREVILPKVKAEPVEVLKPVKRIIPAAKIVKKPEEKSIDQGKGLSRTEALLAKLESEKKNLSDSPVVSDISNLSSAVDAPDEYLDIHQELKKEDQNQLNLKQELLKQDLLQVEDRKILFTKTINQLDYHYQLKEKESKLTIESYQNKLIQNTAIKKKKLSDLLEIQIKRENTQQEFEAMELASIEFEKSNLQERKEEKEKVESLEKKQKQAEKDRKKVIGQQAKKKKALEELRKRVLQAEKELNSLVDEELELSFAQEKITKKKLETQREIEEKLVKQHQDREHYLQLEELKFQSLQRTKKQYFLVQQEILHLEHEQKNIQQGAIESELVSVKEIDQLQEQRNLKQQMLDRLVLEYEQKKIELKTIQKEQDDVVREDSLEEMRKLFALEA